MSAWEAALELSITPDSATAPSGDPLVQWIAGAYVAPAWWWRLLLVGPITRDRPRRTGCDDWLPQGHLW